MHPERKETLENQKKIAGMKTKQAEESLRSEEEKDENFVVKMHIKDSCLSEAFFPS